MKNRTLILTLLTLICLTGCTKDKTKETEPVSQSTEAQTTEAPLDYKINESVNAQRVILETKQMNPEDESAYIEQIQETLYDGDAVDKARTNQESIEASQAESISALKESASAANETLSQEQESESIQFERDSEIITPEMHEEFQAEIDKMNQPMLDEYKKLLEQQGK